MMKQLDSQDLNDVTNGARIVAIDHKHGFIHIDHLLAAMLTTQCLSNEYLTALNPEECQTWLQGLYPGTGAGGTEDPLPLTVLAERTLWHATYFAHLKNEEGTNSVHLLLAILSYDNHVSDKAKQAGVIFEDIAAGYYKDIFPRKPPQLKLIPFKKPSALAKFFRLAPSIDTQGEMLYNHAEELFQFQQYDDCMAICRTGLDLMPAFDRLKIMLANCFLMKKDYANAITAFSELDKLYPGVLDYRYSLSYICDETGDYQKAEEILDKLLAQYPDHAYVLNNKGFNLYHQDRYEEAVPFYEKAIRINPSWAYPWDNLGFVKYKLGHTEEALILIDKSLDLDKGNSFAYKYKGIIYMEQDNKTLALEQFQLALKYRYTETYGEEVLQLIKQCR